MKNMYTCHMSLGSHKSLNINKVYFLDIFLYVVILIRVHLETWVNPCFQKKYFFY